MAQVQPVKTIQQDQTLADWAHGSGGILKVTVSYPAEMRQGEKNLITVTYQADATLEAYLDMGYTFDAQLSAEQSVIMPQQRLLKSIQRGKNSFVWEIEPFMSQQLDASIQMAMGDSNLNGTYAISPQITIDLEVPIQNSKGFVRYILKNRSGIIRTLRFHVDCLFLLTKTLLRTQGIICLNNHAQKN